MLCLFFFLFCVLNSFLLGRRGGAIYKYANKGSDETAGNNAAVLMFAKTHTHTHTEDMLSTHTFFTSFQLCGAPQSACVNGAVSVRSCCHTLDLSLLYVFFSPLCDGCTNTHLYITHEHVNKQNASNKQRWQPFRIRTRAPSSAFLPTPALD